jgi:beta-glucosidase
LQSLKRFDKDNSMHDIKHLISQMTLAEKAGLCSGLDFWHLKGVSRLGIPSIMVTDGPHGLRKQREESEAHIGLEDTVPATCFPTAAALAATWNRDLIVQVGAALADECRAENVGVILGPGANIKRSPLCGRNFEYFSEDPYLSGEMAKSHINGMQSKGVGASLKHFAVNNQEFRRMTIDAIVDERALHEIYLAGFETAVTEAQPWTVMCAYNRINGSYGAEHPTLMRDILKEKWGHEGLVVTDWGAMNDAVAAIKAGVELEMPGSLNGNAGLVFNAVATNKLDESVLDSAVERILQLIFKAQETLAEPFTTNLDAHHRLARKVAGEGAVLLKNENSILPLPKDCKIAVLGQFAKEPRFQGAGSSLINPHQLDNFYDELAKLVGAENLSYAPGYDESGHQIHDALIAAAKNAAAAADMIVICAGLPAKYEVEGLDREHMKLPPAHDALIEAVAAEHDNVVVVLSNGSPVEMPWIDNVSAVLEGYLGGQAGAGALADILVGDVNPSGKLAETFPVKLEDNPSYHYFPGGPATVEYRESFYVGYRYYDTVDENVLFPFGHGLSYTSFEYTDLQVSQEQMKDTDTLTVTLKVKNMGAVAGQEIMQLYVRDVACSTFRPDKELKGFVKVKLDVGEETAVSISLSRRAFAFYNPTISDWQVESGSFDILVGASSRDIRLHTTVHVESTQIVDGEMAAAPSGYTNPQKGQIISQQAFETLLGHPMPANKIDTKGSYTINTPMEDLRGSFIGNQLHKFMQTQVDARIEGDKDSPTALLMYQIAKEAPLRFIMTMGDGVLTRGMLEGLLMMLNGKRLQGAIALIKAAINKK